jgi:hypothetical protein
MGDHKKAKTTPYYKTSPRFGGRGLFLIYPLRYRMPLLNLYLQLPPRRRIKSPFSPVQGGTCPPPPPYHRTSTSLHLRCYLISDLATVNKSTYYQYFIFYFNAVNFPLLGSPVYFDEGEENNRWQGGRKI